MVKIPQFSAYLPLPIQFLHYVFPSCCVSLDVDVLYLLCLQHVLERGKPHERRQIIGKLSGHIVKLSQHKFASNVVEKCLEYGGPVEQELIISEIVGHNEGNDNLLVSRSYF